MTIMRCTDKQRSSCVLLIDLDLFGNISPMVYTLRVQEA